METLVPVLVGGLLAIAGGALGAVLQSHREHRQWIRDERLKAFVSIQAVVQHMQTFELERAAMDNDIQAAKAGSNPAQLVGLITKLEALIGRVAAMKNQLAETSAPLSVLGPPGVERAVNGLLNAWDDDNERRQAEVHLVREMRRSLRI